MLKRELDEEKKLVIEERERLECLLQENGGNDSSLKNYKPRNLPRQMPTNT